MKILAANVGSSSYKYKLIEMDREEVLAWGKVERIGSLLSPAEHWVKNRKVVSEEIHAPDHNIAVKQTIKYLLHSEDGLFTSLEDLDAVGFKTVHAGPITGPCLIDEQVLDAMTQYIPVAPAHNPSYIAVIRSFQQLAPDIPLVAVFEPGFHSTIPEYAQVYSVPYSWYKQYGIRRYGFHGASFTYLSQRIPELISKPLNELKVVACHLGGSSSVCAMKDGVSLDTSMGFSPQSGLPMGKRCGDIDPFLIPFVAEREKLSYVEVMQILNDQSGLLGISGVSADMRDLEQAAAAGKDRARLAVESFAYQVKKFIGAYAAVLGGLDALIFTGGIGENAASVRQRICEGLDFLGVKLDAELNTACDGREMRISLDDVPVQVWVVPANEEIVVARAARRVLEETNQKHG